jgi:hypothetical protein
MNNKTHTQGHYLGAKAVLAVEHHYPAEPIARYHEELGNVTRAEDAPAGLESR